MLKHNLKTNRKPRQQQQPSPLTPRSNHQGQRQTCSDALAELYSRIYPKVSRQCLKMLGDTIEAADAAQDIFLIICSKNDSFRGEASMMTWVYRITVNYCLNRLRRSRDHRRLWGQFFPSSDCFIDTSVEQVVEHKDLLQRVLCGCSPAEVDLVLAAYLDQMNQKEIGAVLGISDRSVRNRLSIVKNKVERQRKLVEEMSPAYSQRELQVAA